MILEGEVNLIEKLANAYSHLYLHDTHNPKDVDAECEKTKTMILKKIQMLVKKIEK